MKKWERWLDLSFWAIAVPLGVFVFFHEPCGRLYKQNPLLLTIFSIAATLGGVYFALRHRSAAAILFPVTLSTIVVCVGFAATPEGLQFNELFFKFQVVFAVAFSTPAVMALRVIHWRADTVRRKRLAENLCLNCGYPRQGLDDRPCSECGTPVWPNPKRPFTTDFD